MAMCGMAPKPTKKEEEKATCPLKENEENVATFGMG